MIKDKKFKINNFKYPTKSNIRGRTSTICRSMACTLIKREGCSQEDEKKWMKFFPDGKTDSCIPRKKRAEKVLPYLSKVV